MNSSKAVSMDLSVDITDAISIIERQRKNIFDALSHQRYVQAMDLFEAWLIYIASYYQMQNITWGCNLFATIAYHNIPI